MAKLKLKWKRDQFPQFGQQYTGDYQAAALSAWENAFEILEGGANLTESGTYIAVAHDGAQQGASERAYLQRRRAVATLQRIADGTFGECQDESHVDCSGYIRIERLQAKPTAGRCIVCQRSHEATAAPRPRVAVGNPSTALA